MKRSTKIWLIVATCLVLGGSVLFAGVLAAHGFDIHALSTVHYETTTQNVAESFTALSLQVHTADVVLKPSDDGVCRVVFCEPEGVTGTATVKNGTLVIEEQDTRAWYDRIEIFSFESAGVTVYLPKATLDSIIIKSTTGDVTIEPLAVGSLDVSVSTSHVDVRSITCTRNVNVSYGTGEITLTDVTCQNLTATGSTGDVTLQNVIARGTLTAECSTGDVHLDRCDAAELRLKTSTGDITGSLLSDKVFLTQTSTGRVSVPDTATGGICRATTGTGDIDLSIA